MRIGLTCTTIESALTQGKIDGIGVYTKTLYEQFSKLNHEVIAYSFPTFKKWLKSSEFENGKIFPLPYTAATIGSLIKPAADILYGNLNTQVDLLHTTDHMIPRATSVPIIATIHDALMFTHPEWYQSKLRGVKNRLRKETFKWANHFITVSQSMVSELVEYMGIPEKKISVVHNGISDWWHEEVSAEQKQITLDKLQLPKKFLLFTGTLQPKKNVSRIIEAFLSLPKDIREEYPLVIAGKAGWDADEIRASIANLKSQQAGYWLDYVSNEELRILYQSATVYLCPSLHEGFGYTLLEAFASKTPAITSNLSALPEVANGAAYLVDPYSVSEITHAIQELVSSPSLQQELILKGTSRVRDFTLEKCAQNTLSVYQKLN
jgi:glycosyltransferase involved in cell wall biosynthesis